MAKKDELEFEGGIENAPKPNNSEKLKALQAAMDKIEKSFGKGSIMKMGDDHVQEVEVIPTGSIALNAALGVGGYPKGRIIEIYGPESSGKTTLAIHAIAEAQKAGGIAAFIDAEHAFDRFYAAKLGVDIDNLWISQPDNGEQALEIAEQLIRSSAQLTIYQLFCFCFLNFFDFKVLQIQQFCCIIFIEHIGPPLIWFCNFYFNGFLTNMLYFFKNFLILFLCSALGFPNIYYSAKITG